MDPQTNPLQKRIKGAQTYDTEVSQALESVLRNGPHSVTRGLDDWNLEDGLILHRGHIYVPKDDDLRRDIVKQYHDHVATGHLGRWKTYKLVASEWHRFSKPAWVTGKGTEGYGSGYGLSNPHNP
jgi:hypothetical protein